MQKIGKCKLCHAVRPLLNESHIIPEFMYSGLFNEHHKINKLAPSQYVKGNRRVMRPSSGEYEDGLLCQECDNERIGGLEAYAHAAMFGGKLSASEAPKAQTYKTQEGVKFTRVSNISYTKFKLFLLSILWRASISKRDFFKEVKLGPHENVIREMILSGDPMRYDDYPVIFFTSLTDKSAPRDIVGQPGKNRAGKGIRYVFIIAGITYVFHVSKNSIDPSFLPYTLLPSNEITIFHIPDGKSWGLIQTYFGMNK